MTGVQTCALPNSFELPIPDELKDQIAEGVEVDYIEAMGKQKIMRVK